VPGLRNLEKRLLHIEARLAPRAEPQVPMELIRSIFDRMNEADRKRVSELKATREQIAAKISDDTQFRAFARRAISLATAVGLFRLRPGDSTR
jgi:hypothetical protein